MIMYSHVPTNVGMYGTQQTKMSLIINLMWFVVVWTTIGLSISSVDRSRLNDSTEIPLLHVALCSSSLVYTTIHTHDMYKCSTDRVGGYKGWEEQGIPR